METIMIITNIRELLALYRWLLIKVAKDPRKARQIMRLMLYGRTRKRKVKIKG